MRAPSGAGSDDHHRPYGCDDAPPLLNASSSSSWGIRENLLVARARILTGVAQKQMKCDSSGSMYILIQCCNDASRKSIPFLIAMMHDVYVDISCDAANSAYMGICSLSDG